MNIALKKTNKENTFKSESGNSEMAFIYNIIMPDFLLFTVSLSFAFGLLLSIFGSTI